MLIPDQNGQSVYQKGPKTLPVGAAYAYLACIREYPPGIFVSLLDKTFGDSNRNLAFDLSITDCQSGVWEATGTISAEDARIVFQSLPHVRDFSERSHHRSFVTSFSLPWYISAGNRGNVRCFLSAPYAMLLHLSLDSLFSLLTLLLLIFRKTYCLNPCSMLRALTSGRFT